MWARHEVRAKTASTKRFRHPLIGDLTLGFETFSVNSAPASTLSSTEPSPAPPPTVPDLAGQLRPHVVAAEAEGAGWTDRGMDRVSALSTRRQAEANGA
ncbi:hypothetical protein K1Y78_28020 [Streptomyces sp. tea 10]|nr:hypothetical protein [Streptomyces sp. tea 10]